jgi:hypothetical protein
MGSFPIKIFFIIVLILVLVIGNPQLKKQIQREFSSITSLIQYYVIF